MGSFRETVWPLPGCLAGWLRDLHQDKTDPGRCRFQSPVASGSGGMIMIALTLSSMFALAFAAPAPQGMFWNKRKFNNNCQRKNVSMYRKKKGPHCSPHNL